MPNRIWAALLAFTPALALAQSIPPATEARIANLEGAVKSAQSAGDNDWMLVSAALVLMMTGPGLALFYAGLVRRKKRIGHHDAQLQPDGCGDGGVGYRWLQPGFR